MTKIEDIPLKDFPPEILEQIGQYSDGYETFLNAVQTRHDFVMTPERRQHMIIHAIKSEK